MSLETQLRDALVSRADALDAPAFDPYERVAGAVVTQRRRRRVATAGAVAAVAVVALIVPGLVQGGHDSTLPAKRTQVVVPGPNDPRWRSFTTWPTRGSLATDKAFLDTVGMRFGALNILYAADLPTSRVVVSYNSSADDAQKLTMYSGPRGAAAGDLAEVSSSAGGLDDVVSIREHADEDSTLVVLASPAVSRAGISRSVQIGLDGSVTRDAFRPVTLADGMYAEVLEDSPPALTRVSVEGDDQAAAKRRVTLMGRPTKDAAGEGSICMGCTGEDFRAKAELAIGEGDAYRLGIDPKDVRTTTRFFGAADPAVVERTELGAKGQVTSQVIVVDTTLPAGQVLRSAVVVVSEKDGSQAMTMESATGVPIDAATAAERPFVLDQQVDGDRVIHQVFAPTAAKVQLVSPGTLAYPPSAVVPVRNGSAIVTTPRTDPSIAPYEVVTFDAAGTQTGRWPIDLPSEDEWMGGATP